MDVSPDRKIKINPTKKVMNIIILTFLATASAINGFVSSDDIIKDIQCYVKGIKLSSNSGNRTYRKTSCIAYKFMKINLNMASNYFY